MIRKLSDRQKLNRRTAQKITDMLFCDKGIDRLALEGPEHREKQTPSANLAGWCKEAVISRIVEILDL